MQAVDCVGAIVGIAMQNQKKSINHMNPQQYPINFVGGYK